jgi:hypothetical protein
MQFVNTSWSGMQALKNILGHFGIHLQLASEQEVAVKGHVNEFTVPLPYFRVHLDAGKAAKGKGVIDEGCRRPVSTITIDWTAPHRDSKQIYLYTTPLKFLILE